MDYGPFGFIEKFRPLWNMWQNSGDHFGFLNQPAAGAKNVKSLQTALSPLMQGEVLTAAVEVARRHEELAEEEVDRVWKQKLGFDAWDEERKELSHALLSLMYQTEADYTITWRQLAVLVDAHLPALLLLADEQALRQALEQVADAELVKHLVPVAFYTDLSAAQTAAWARWLRTYLEKLAGDSHRPADEVSGGMRAVSPVYVPREWMLVDAYTAAMQGDISKVEELRKLFEAPYDEQGEANMSRYYRRAPAEVYESGGVGGTSFMT